MGVSWREYSIDDLKAKSPGAIAIGPFGSRMKSEVYVDTGIPVIRGNNISKSKNLEGDFVFVTPETAQRLGSANVYDGDLVFPHRGAIGEVGIVTGGPTAHYVLSTSLMKLTCNREFVEPLFLFYFFRSPLGRHELLKNASTVGTPGIATPLTSLRQIRLLVPPLETQRAIAHVLGTLDDKIELNRRTNHTLEAIAKALFKSWFVDFDPVRAKAEGRQPEGMDAETAALFPDGFGEDGLPRGWRIGKLGDFARLSRDAVNPQEFPQEIFEHFSIPAFDDDQKPTLEMGKFIRSNKFIVPDNCILVSKLNPDTPRVWLPIPNPNVRSIASTEFLVLVPKTPTNRALIYGFTTSALFTELLASRVTGTSKSHQRVKPGDVLNVEALIPPAKIQESYASIVNPLLHQQAINRLESRTLAALRDALLPRLLSGEISVAAVEQMLAERGV